MSKSFINTWSLHFHDEEIEESFRLDNIQFESRLVKIFLLMLIGFNAIYAAKDFYFTEQRDLISLQFQVFFILPVYVAMSVYTNRFKHLFQNFSFYSFAVFLCVFTIVSQLCMLYLNGDNGKGLDSIVLIAIFGSFIFSGILYRQMLGIVPFVLVVLIIFLVFLFELPLVRIINVSLIYTMAICASLLTKYQIERQRRLSYNRAASLMSDEKDIKESYLRINALSEMRRDLIAILAHDVRSPLASLQGVLSLTKSGSLSPEESREYLEKVEQQVSTVNFLVNDILIWIKSQSDEADFEKGPVNLSSIIEDLKFLFLDAFEEKQIEFKVSLTIDNVYGQPDMIKTILRNFISNAIKFSDKGTAIVLESRPEGSKVRISVRDHGMGMTADELAKLKNTFNTKLGTRKEKGMGLGLKICRALIQAHKSNLEVISQPNEGTTMSFLLNRA
ncbi:sensor histidine kinase [Reichenbachiella ulvae]|uniref:histidine kinase n=1 Tax=Reichenbachiella ulvae TaxID=2980104 RepID=A0ABT3CXF2_9BACT|nr:HAMP domain-containing sensor histidine kinase [Reichenbachiella ulvae]MCV9388377.1 HAMP domain-containing histidine kinase [Reichenbachiella ulvae]